MKIKAVSRIILTLLLIGMLTLAFNIQPVKSDWTWTETIYIRADGSIDPDTAPISSVDNITYTFTDNIYDEIVVERDNIIVDGAGYTVLGTGAFLYTKGIDLAGRKNVTLRNMSIEGFYYGIYLEFSSNNSILGNNKTNNEYGIRLDHSTNNSISRNNITANNDGGIWLFYSSNNCVSGNDITENNWEGILLAYSFDNSISGNKVTNNYDGIILADSSINSISGNNITENKGAGIPIVSSSSNIIFGNDLVANRDGIHLLDSSDNLIYHNNFLNNTRQVYDLAWTNPGIQPSRNTWDWGYPSGGNYWSDYSGVDKKSGTNQDRHGSDGIGDTPYVIDENKQDNYPLIRPFPSPLDSTRELNETIKTWSLPKGTENKLTSKLYNAIHLLIMENENGAVQKLMNFIDQVDKLRGNKLTNEQADQLISEAQRIIDLIKG